jgi:predicted lipoprotein
MKRGIYLLLLLCTIVACSDDENVNESDNFNREALLTHTADNLIIPAFVDLSSKLSTLETAVSSFTSSPDASTLTNARMAWLEAYKSWQYVEIYNIGLAEQELYNFQVNIYPTNIIDIQNNINSENVDLAAAGNNDAVGFPAIEYLLYGTGTTDQEVVEFYSTNSNSESNAAHLNELTVRLKTLTDMILTDWRNGYRDQFISSTSNTSTSSLNKIVNDFIFYYEKGLRANKVGIPAGVFSSNPRPDLVEGVYSKNHSKELLLNALDAVQDFYNGIDYNSNVSTGTGLADYVNDRAGDSSLSNDINAQLDLVRTKIINDLDDNLNQQVNTNNSAMISVYDELQQVVVLIKTDMLQVLNISVDFIDSDGD